MITKFYNIDEYRLEVQKDNNGFRTSLDKTCPHLHLFFDENGQTVECKDCKKQVTAWWALFAMAKGLERERQRLDGERKQLEDEKAKQITHKAALKVQSAWRKKSMVPVCPHCLHAIFPEDGFGYSMVSKEDPEGARRSMIKANKILGIATGEIK